MAAGVGGMVPNTRADRKSHYRPATCRSVEGRQHATDGEGDLHVQLALPRAAGCRRCCIWAAVRPSPLATGI